MDIRSVHEQLADKIDLLEGRDKVIMAMYLEQGFSMSEIARLVGVTASSMTRRIKKIASRLALAQVCFNNRDIFELKELEVIAVHLLRGLSLKQSASECNCSYYLARKANNKVKDLKEQFCTSCREI
jgi:transposase-like protein